MQHETQSFIDRALQPLRKRARMLCEESTIKRQDLRNIDYRIAGQAGIAGRKQNVAGSFGKIPVACDSSDDHRLNLAVV